MEAGKNRKCIVCNSKEIHPLKGYEVSQLVKCSNCSHVFEERIPSQEELKKHYVYGVNHYYSPLTAKRYNELLDSLEEFRETNNLLDLGCGTGLFLEEAKKRDWNVFGTELNDEAIRICEENGISMKTEEWLKEKENAGIFDIVTAWELIEHIGQPNGLISQVNGMLRSGGVMYSTTPNFNAANRYLLRNKYTSVIDYPDHLSYFTPKTMDHLMVSHGFKRLRVSTTGYSITTFKNALKISNQEFIAEDSDDEQLRLSIDKSRTLELLKKLINKVFTLLGIGESLKSLYQKY